MDVWIWGGFQTADLTADLYGYGRHIRYRDNLTIYKYLLSYHYIKYIEMETKNQLKKNTIEKDPIEVELNKFELGERFS